MSIFSVSGDLVFVEPSNGFWGQGWKAVLGFDANNNPNEISGAFVGANLPDGWEFGDPIPPAPFNLEVYLLNAQGVDIVTATQTIQDEFCSVAPGASCP